jgi:hypothetical protein
VRVTLVAEQKARADDGDNRTGVDRVSHACGVGDSDGDEDPDLQRCAYLFVQLERRSRRADVAASLNPLRDDRARARGSGRLRLVDRPALVHPGGYRWSQQTTST